jgi:hypothetical protein
MTDQSNNFGANVFGVAHAASDITEMVDAHKKVGLQYDFDPVVITRLTEIVNEIRGDFLGVIANKHLGSEPIYQISAGQLEKRIIALISNGLFQFMDVFASIAQLIFEFKDSGLLNEQVLSDIENLTNQRISQLFGFNDITSLNSGYEHVFGGLKSRE